MTDYINRVFLLSFDKSERPFLRQIKKSRRSLESKLIYADWLMERGDPRGEIISFVETLYSESALLPDSEYRKLRQDIATLVNDVRRHYKKSRGTDWKFDQWAIGLGYDGAEWTRDYFPHVRVEITKKTTSTPKILSIKRDLTGRLRSDIAEIESQRGIEVFINLHVSDVTDETFRLSGYYQPTTPSDHEVTWVEGVPFSYAKEDESLLSGIRFYLWDRCICVRSDGRKRVNWVQGLFHHKIRFEWRI